MKISKPFMTILLGLTAKKDRKKRKAYPMVPNIESRIGVPYGDDPRDQKWIKLGIDYWKRNY